MVKGTGNILRIVLGGALGIVLLTAVFFLAKIVHISRLALAIVWLLEVVLITVRWKLTRQSVYRLIQTGAIREHYILVGNGCLARQYLGDLANAPYSGVVTDG